MKPAGTLSAGARADLAVVHPSHRLSDERSLAAQNRIDQRIDLLLLESRRDQFTHRRTFVQRNPVRCAVAAVDGVALLESGLERRVIVAPLENFSE